MQQPQSTSRRGPGCSRHRELRREDARRGPGAHVVRRGHLQRREDRVLQLPELHVPARASAQGAVGRRRGLKRDGLGRQEDLSASRCHRCASLTAQSSLTVRCKLDFLRAVMRTTTF